MEEVDNIIIDSLKNINCVIDTDVTNLKGFTENDIACAIATCLEIIIPNMNIAKRMPVSMSARLKYASVLVDHIKSLGFTGDLGYQSILYSNEIEIRRILMFLIERLPKESSKVAVTETFEYVPMLVKEIGIKMKLATNNVWIKPNLLQNGLHIMDDDLKLSYGNSICLSSKLLHMPQTSLEFEGVKNYSIHYLVPVTEQCNSHELIPSLLFNGNDLKIKEQELKEYVLSKYKQLGISSIKLDIDNLESQATTNSIMNVQLSQKTSDNIQSQLMNILRMINTKKNIYFELQNVVMQSQAQLMQINALKEQNQLNLKGDLNSLHIKLRTQTVLTKEVNVTKLKSMVTNGNERLLNLANQWNEVQTPLLEQYRTLQMRVSEQDLKLKEEKEQLKLLKNRAGTLDEELFAKHSLEKILIDEMAKSNSNTNRTSYTKRILEIIANIRKQDVDIAKILNDTQSVQREINTLTGQLERSFALSDALIFKDAKCDEIARRSYKQLATLHLDCEAIVQAVRDVGVVQRECRNIEEQIEAEVKKDIETKLKRVLHDIEVLQKEQSM